MVLEIRDHEERGVEEREKILFYSRKNKAAFEFSYTRCFRA